MPDKKGRFTKQEQVFTAALAQSGDAAFAAWKAGYRSETSLLKAQNPAILAEVERINLQNMAENIAPAWTAIRDALKPEAHPGYRSKTAMWLIELSKKWNDNGGEGTDPAEMTPEQLAEAIVRLEAFKAAKAVDITPAEDVDDGIFG